MSLSSVTEHIVPGQHIREYPHAIKKSKPITSTLCLAVKEYRPLNTTPAPNALTIIASHAIGIPKECYEPLWDALLTSMAPASIRAIWIADCANHGASAVLNEHLNGDDPNFFDHSRDLLQLTNHSGDEMQPPIVGIGHSMGASHLAHLPTLHPRLLWPNTPLYSSPWRKVLDCDA